MLDQGAVVTIESSMICKASDVSATECVCFKLACLVDRRLLLLGSCVSVSSVRININKADFQSVQSQICQETTWTRFFKNYPAYVCIRVWHKKSQLSKRKFCKKQNRAQLKKLHMMGSPFVCLYKMIPMSSAGCWPGKVPTFRSMCPLHRSPSEKSSSQFKGSLSRWLNTTQIHGTYGWSMMKPHQCSYQMDRFGEWPSRKRCFSQCFKTEV